MMAVAATPQPTFVAARPAVLFEGDYVATEFPLTGAAYDVSPDGQRLLMVKAVGERAPTAPAPLSIVLNWFEELRRRVPAP